MTDGAAEFESVLAGDHDIEYEEGRTLAFGVGDHVRAGGIYANHEAIILKMVADETCDIGVVFDDKDAWFHGFIVAKAAATT